MKKLKVGLIGKMRGLSVEAVERKFKLTQLDLEKLGYEVFNPVNLGLPHTGLETSQYLDHTIPELYKCDVVFVHSDHLTSGGSMGELVAVRMKNIEEFHENQNGLKWIEIHAVEEGIHPHPEHLLHKKAC